MPDGITLSDGAVIRFAATDPTTGASVNGVKVSNMSIFCDVIEGAEALLQTGPYILVPGAPPTSL
jgi:hypothetical protein